MTKIFATPNVLHAADKQRSKPRPNLFRVLMHNDDYTTMDFVMEVLQSVFHKESHEATLLMLQIHRKGIALCGVYPFDIAETKVDKIHRLARGAGFPLRCTLEPE